MLVDLNLKTFNDAVQDYFRRTNNPVTPVNFAKLPKERQQNIIRRSYPQVTILESDQYIHPNS